MLRKKYDILIENISNPLNINIQEINSTRVIDPALELTCSNLWQEMLLDAKKKKKELWNSEIYRFESVIIKDGIINLKISTIPFSIVLPINKKIRADKDFDTKLAPLSMFTSCFVRTIDNKYIFLKKSDKYYSTKKISFIGGTLSKTEKIIATGYDLFNEAKKEIKEEIGLNDSDIANLVLKGGYVTENFGFCMLFEAVLSCDFNTAKNKFKLNSDGEGLDIIGVDDEELNRYTDISLDEFDVTKIEILKLN